jgi:hypothetical protein
MEAHSNQIVASICVARGYGHCTICRADGEFSLIWPGHPPVL